MAAGDFAGKVLRMTAGIMSEIDPKNTLKVMGKDSVKALNKNSRAFKAGKNAANFLGGGIRDTARNMSKAKGSQSLGTALKNAHSHMVKDANGNLVKELSTKKIAGTAIGVSMAGRVITGGGLYKDKHGNTNLPGIPFI